MRYEIIRSEWVCGDGRFLGMGDTSLLNGEGRMCCLGQICKASGLADEELRGESCPADVGARAPKWLRAKNTEGRTISSKVAANMIGVNDDHSLTQKEREARLKRLAKSAGHTLVFTGSLGVKRHRRED